MSDPDVHDWQQEAVCRYDANDVPGSERISAMAWSSSLTDVSAFRSLCQTCSVRLDCASNALEVKESLGIWGGLTQQERRHLLRSRPDVADWQHLLETAIAEYDLVSATFDEDFADLFEQQFCRLVGFLITAGARRQDAEDAVQMAFVELARHWTEVCERSGWLRRVAHRMWSKVVVGSRESLVADVYSDAVIASADDAALAERHRVLQLLSRLPEQQRVVLAFAYDGCTPAETAETLGVPAVNIRQNLKRARAALARLIAEEGII
ncbi:sigma-70 family RNA polymerase sigma factor [Streptomyces sp. NPDC055815]